MPSYHMQDAINGDIDVIKSMCYQPKLQDAQPGSETRHQACIEAEQLGQNKHQDHPNMVPCKAVEWGQHSVQSRHLILTPALIEHHIHDNAWEALVMVDHALKL